MPEAQKQSWFKSQPLDEHGSRTMFRGLIIAFAIYGLSIVISAVYRDYPWGNWVSIALIGASVVFLAAWFIAVRRGFRMGKPKSRANRRAKMHAEQEREKRARMR